MTSDPSPREVARQLAATCFAARAAMWDRTRDYCWQNVAELAEAGLMGMTIPTAYGGRGASFLEVCGVIEEVAKACTLTARVVVEANMGAISAIMAYGSAAQKERVAPLVLAGDKPAICITEPTAGSAAGEMVTTARRVAGGYRLAGHKHWITGGGVSRVHLVFARVHDARGREEGIGGFILIADPRKGEWPAGFTVVRRERTMGLCGMPEAELRFDDVFVPDEMVLCPPSGFARGFADLMSAYNSQRVGAGTIAMGVAAGALDHARRYLLERHQFGRPLAEFQGLQWMLADMDTGVHASRLMLEAAAASAATSGTGFPDKTMAARAKLFASETAIRVVNDALQMFGARGYGDAEPLERMARDVRMFTIGGGTAQVLRTQIAGAVLGMKTPQTRDGYARLARAEAAQAAAE
ncbi:3-sulfinopropanoyl-CoA desulfinase [Acuticoccus mangrovi]|uniref:3-sulfinopropanoyl-CoA desulfinase n=1 Tax=Acuticoccus mangrovi TaxID=2796142 RepID=A0A934IQB8_9HYPH|nr:3-sulfinopropanoyl-CoA desulfinase [Acuticoccus mangrovi]MBJ3776751.1 acyl-CoA dehydrogenase family protein [Acuticoccus mangrovi]